jgi:8-oxo-dGTP pyrophosphatase MutT (NUDIX family)
MTHADRDGLVTKRDDAAGGLVVSRGNGRLRVVLIAVDRDASRRWSLPKGHFKKRESSEQTAVREVREETGLEVEIVAPLTTIDYWFVERKVRYHKFVHYFVMRAVGGRFDDHDDEVHDVRWFDWDDALRTMAYPNERSVLEEHRERIEQLF